MRLPWLRYKSSFTCVCSLGHAAAVALNPRNFREKTSQWLWGGGKLLSFQTQIKHVTVELLISHRREALRIRLYPLCGLVSTTCGGGVGTKDPSNGGRGKETIVFRFNSWILVGEPLLVLSRTKLEPSSTDRGMFELVL